MKMQNNLEDMVNSLLLPEGTYQNSSYIVKLKNSNEYSRYYDSIARDDRFELVDHDQDENESYFIFQSDNFEQKLEGSFSDDVYMITISRR